MFDIEYKGANSVVITTKKSKLVVDPKLSVAGLKDLSVDGAVELSTEARFAVNGVESILSIEGPGEYGVAGFEISGIPAQRHIDTGKDGLLSTIYRIEIGDARICIVGNIDSKLSDEQLERIGVIDVLIIPVGGNGYTLNATDAASIVRMIDPKVVVPVHYSDSALKYEVPQDNLGLFTAELGVPIETVAKYKVKQLPLPSPTLTVIEITRS